MNSNLDIYQRDFSRNGYVVVPNILSPEQLDELRAAVDGVLDGAIRPTLPEPGEEAPREDFTVQWEPSVENDPAVARRDKLRVAFHLCHTHPFFHAHATRPELLAVVRALLGDEVRLYTDQLFVKPPQHGSEVPFHQDHAYWTALEPYNMVSCWLALDDATIENGCVHMLPGTHDHLIPHREFKGPQTLGLLPEDVDASHETPVEIEAGSAMFHHSLTVHRSFANRSDKRRRGLVTIYAPAEIRFVAPWPFRYGFRRIVGNVLED
jgi:ectoine hydroxylase-related dioxygenase (phytanoyl-CoA dioxygenase family)